MTDLDFDELDKAVNNLMSTVDTTKRNPGLDDPEDKVISLSSDAGSVSTAGAATIAQSPPVSLADEAHDEPEVAPELSAETSHDNQAEATHSPAPTSISVPERATPLAIKRRGQFMDIMSPAKPAPAPVSRQGVSLQPSATAAAEVAAAREPEAPTLDESMMAMPDLESTGAAQPGMMTMPDPIDMATDTAAHTAALDELPEGKMPVESSEQLVVSTGDVHSTSSELSDALPAEVLDEVAAHDTPAEEAPLTTPFLADAKVDKRPLGSPIAVVEASAQSELSTPNTEASSEESAGPQDVANMTRSEAESTAPTEPSVAASTEGSVSEATVEPPMPIQTNIDTQEVATSSSAHEVATTQPTGGGSIAQQYAEQPSTSDQTTGAMFDTATYHKAVEEPVKKKSSKVVTTLLWVLVLVAVGAAAGAGYFYWTTHS